MANLVGQRIANYEIISILGLGGMAVVYHARQLDTGREVAIKVFKPSLTDEDSLRRFEDEANIVASLNHPHILKLLDFGQYEDMLYLVMELMPGNTLADTLRESPLLPERAARLLDQVASALDDAYSHGLLYHDLKPNKVLLDNRGNAYLTDFGIAKIVAQASAATPSGATIGTPAYMPPEQWQGNALDARSTIYTLGVMLYEMLTGKLPFTADSPASWMYQHVQTAPPSVRTIKLGLPRDVDRVIQKAMAKAPEDRFASASEMAKALQAAIEANAPKFNPETDFATLVRAEQPQTLSARVRSRGPLTAIIAGVLVILVVGGLLILHSASGSPSPTSTTSPTHAPTQVAAVLASSTASLTASATIPPTQTLTPLPTTAIPTLTSTLLPATVAPTSTTMPATSTEAPTLDSTVVAEQTIGIAMLFNGTPTERFIEDQTATATLWTLTPTPSLTPSSTLTPSLTFTPSITYTPTLIATPALLVWDTFRSISDESVLWQIRPSSTGNTTRRVVPDGLMLQTDGSQTRWVRASRIHAIAALVTLETDGAYFDILVNGAYPNNLNVTYKLGFDCNMISYNKNVGKPGSANVFSGIQQNFQVSGCPQTHLLLIQLDGKQAHGYVDGQDLGSGDLLGSGSSAGTDFSVNTQIATHGVVILHKVWLKAG